MHGFMVSFHCRPDLFERMERFAIQRNIDRTSVLKLALHFHLNRLLNQQTEEHRTEEDRTEEDRTEEGRTEEGRTEEDRTEEGRMEEPSSPAWGRAADPSPAAAGSMPRQQSGLHAGEPRPVTARKGSGASPGQQHQ